MIHEKGGERRRFYYWDGMAEQYRKLSDERKVRLVDAMLLWAFDDADTDFSDDELLDAIWPPLRQSIEVSVAQGIEAAEKGRRSGAARKAKRASNTATNSVRNSVRNSVPNDKKKMRMNDDESSSSPSAASGGADGSEDGPCAYVPPETDALTLEGFERMYREGGRYAEADAS